VTAADGREPRPDGPRARSFSLAESTEGRGKAQLTTLFLARSILQAIERQSLMPGDVLPPEAELARQFGVSKGSLREALRLLEVHGFVVVKSGAGGGPRVSDPQQALGFARAATLFLQQSRARLGELLDARVELEPMMASLAAVLPHDERLDDLRSVVETHRTLDLGDDRAYKEATVDFHHVIGGASGNKVLDLLGRGVLEVFYAKLPDVLLAAEHRGTMIDEHDRIAKAIFAGKPKVAERLMRGHLDSIRTGLRTRYPELMERVINWD
jgi:DNA-binding FadR family transcriptional regulator